MLRFGVGSLIDANVQKTGQIFPWGTIVVNIHRLFRVRFHLHDFGGEGRLMLSSLTRQFILIGILGGYTTFSSFSPANVDAGAGRQWIGAAANVLLSVVLCFGWGLVGRECWRLAESNEVMFMQIPEMPFCFAFSSVKATAGTQAAL